LQSQNVKLQIWDTAGQERFNYMTRNFFNKADGILIVYDATNEESFLSVDKWLKQIE
jgi:GTPase SAR1 family protein